MKIANKDHPIEKSEIGALISSFRQSGLSLERFAREHRIPPGRLHYWLYQKYRTSQAKPSRSGSGAGSVPLFQEVRFDATPLMASWAAEVNIDGKLDLRFSATADPGWIGAVIQAVRRPC